MKLTLDPWQQEFLDCKGDKILCCGRQVGKSVICGMDCGEWAAHNTNNTVLMIAPTERQAYALFDKTLSYLIENYPKLICKGTKRPTKTKIQLKNKITIWCLPTGISGVGIRFLTIGRLYRDEDSRIPREVSAAVDPMMLTTGGDTVRLSTPFGTDNDFADVVSNKDGAYDSYTRFSVSSREVIENRKICATWTPIQRKKALEQLDREKKRKSELEYAQEYEGKLVDSIMQMYNDELILSCMDGKPMPTPNPETKNFLGVDVAGMGGDDIVLFPLMLKNKYLYQIGLEIYNKQRTTKTVRDIKDMDLRFEFRKLYIDDGGMGVAVFDPLLEDPQTKRRVVAINNSSRSLDKDKEKGQKKRLLKYDLYANLLVLMEQGRLKLWKDDRVFHSLKSVQKEYIGDKLKISGKDTHCVEAMMRAAWCTKDKHLNIFISY